MGKGTLLSPVPMEYGTYTDLEKLEKTNEFFEKINKIRDNVIQKRDEYRNRIDTLLASDSTAEMIGTIMQEEEGFLLFNYDNDFAVFRTICQIAEYEEKFGEPIILHNFFNMKDACDWLQQCVLNVRRFEFDCEDGKEFLELFQQKKISYICLAEIICRCEIIRKYKATENLVLFLFRSGWKREAILLLIWVEQMLLYDEELIMRFTMILLDMGERKLAYQMIMKYRSPDAYIKEMQRTLAEKM